MQFPITHFPSHVKKYTGSIEKRKRADGGTSFISAIRTKDFRCCKSFQSYEAALAYLKEKNIEFGLPIKNMIREWEDCMEVEVKEGIWSKFDKEDLELIQSRTCRFSASGYVRTSDRGRVVKLHNLIMAHKPGELTVDHINRDPLDNRKCNLRITNQRTQSINQKMQRSNKSGIKGVARITGSDKYTVHWRASWQNENMQPCTKSFAISKYGEEEAKRLAVEFRKKMEETLPHYVTAFQF
nr:HNH-family endonuclease [Marseillevirus cajuinensis]